MHDKFGKIALCLSGGGAKKIIQLGMLEAWKNFGLSYDILFGTSAGALNGCLLHQNELDLARKIWTQIKTKNVYTWDLGNLLSPFFGKPHLFNSEPLTKLLESAIHPEKLYANSLPFYINTTDLQTWTPFGLELRDIKKEEIILYVKASASPPIMFEPIAFRNTELVSGYLTDGGLVNNFSVMSAAKKGANTIVVMTPTTPKFEKPKNLLDMLNLTISIPEYEFLERELRFVKFVNEYQGPFPNLRNIKVVLIQPDTPFDI